MKLSTLDRLRKPAILLLIGALIGFHPVWRYKLPRSSEAWSHLENLERIPSAADAANFGKMLDLFENRQHYTKYPVFYIVAKILHIDTPWKAAVFSASIFSILPLLMFLFARSIFDELTAFVAGLLVAITSAFVYTMNFFSGGEPMAIALLLLALLLHLKYRPLTALPIYMCIIFLHPFTSLFLWVLLLLLPLFSKPASWRDTVETVVCTALYSLSLLAWILFQISTGLPLGHFITANLSIQILSTLFLAITGAVSLILLLRPRVVPLDRLMMLVTDASRRYLVSLILLLEVIFLLLFATTGVPGTEQLLSPLLVAFYVPLLLAIGMTVLRGREAEPFTSAFVFSSLLLIIVGVVIFPKGIPVYRLAPYGAIALALLFSPLVRRPNLRWALPLVFAGLAATTYPGPSFYFGFDEQYYPSEAAAVSRIESITIGGRVLTDVRMEDSIRYLGRSDPVVPEGGPLILNGRDVALLTSQIRQLGFYPPGAEWFRSPFTLNLTNLDLESVRIYDNGRTEILFLSGKQVKLGGIQD